VFQQLKSFGGRSVIVENKGFQYLSIELLGNRQARCIVHRLPGEAMWSEEHLPLQPKLPLPLKPHQTFFFLLNTLNWDFTLLPQ
jgi:hypothetical protein